jgi:hypothetical protein
VKDKTPITKIKGFPENTILTSFSLIILVFQYIAKSM